MRHVVGKGTHRVRRRVLVGVGALVVVLGLVAGGGFVYVQYRFHQIHRTHVTGLAPVTAATASTAPTADTVPGRGRDPGPGAPVSTVPASQAPETILLVGDNCRNCLNGKQAAQFGTAAQVGGGRADVTMLLRVDPVTSTVSILSIPRDLWLPVPNTNRQTRVDAALNNGPGALVSTISDDLGIPINHYIELNFDTFQNAVDGLGGVNMRFPTRVYDSYSGLNMPAGCYHLSGTQALQVARARHLYYLAGGGWHYDGLGDISRIQRDHEFLRVLAKAVAAQGLGNPIADNRLIGAVAKDLTIDSGLSLTDVGRLAEVFSRVNVDTSPQRTLPVDEDTSPTGFVYRHQQYGDVVFPSNNADRPVIDAFLGHSEPTQPPPTLPVTIIDGSGNAGRAATTSGLLHRLGYHIAGTREGSVDSVPAESVVYYPPGHEDQAQRLADNLGGAVAIGQDASIAGTGLTLLVGTNLTVTHPRAGPATPPNRSAPGPTADNAPPAHAPGSTPPGSAAGGTPPTPAAGMTPPTSALIGGLTTATPAYPSFDPTGCPPGMTAHTPPTLPVPSTLTAP